VRPVEHRLSRGALGQVGMEQAVRQEVRARDGDKDVKHVLRAHLALITLRDLVRLPGICISYIATGAPRCVAGPPVPATRAVRGGRRRHHSDLRWRRSDQGYPLCKDGAIAAGHKLRLAGSRMLASCTAERCVYCFAGVTGCAGCGSSCPACACSARASPAPLVHAPLSTPGVRARQPAGASGRVGRRGRGALRLEAAAHRAAGRGAAARAGPPERGARRARQLEGGALVSRASPPTLLLAPELAPCAKPELRAGRLAWWHVARAGWLGVRRVKD